MRRALLGLCLMVWSMGLSAIAHADDSLRCPGGLVQRGDPAIAVRHACGDPSLVDPWIGGAGQAYGVAPSMEEWTYNRGPGRLLQVIVFRDGQVEAIHTDGYGFNPAGPPGGCRPGQIVRGMSKYRLLALCGEPDQQDGYFVYTSRVPGNGRDYYLRRGVIPVYRERWIYNFGANRLLRQVTLENAVVVDEQSLDRGFDR